MPAKFTQYEVRGPSISPCMSPASRRIRRCSEIVDCASGSSATKSPVTHAVRAASRRRILTRVGCPSALAIAASMSSSATRSPPSTFPGTQQQMLALSVLRGIRAAAIGATISRQGGTGAVPEHLGVWVALDGGKVEHLVEVLDDAGEPLFARASVGDQAGLEALLERAGENGDCGQGCRASTMSPISPKSATLQASNVTCSTAAIAAIARSIWRRLGLPPW